MVIAALAMISSAYSASPSTDFLSRALASVARLQKCDLQVSSSSRGSLSALSSRFVEAAMDAGVSVRVVDVERALEDESFLVPSEYI